MSVCVCCCCCCCLFFVLLVLSCSSQGVSVCVRLCFLHSWRYLRQFQTDTRSHTEHVVIIGNNGFIVDFAVVVVAAAVAASVLFFSWCFVLKPQEKSYHRI